MALRTYYWDQRNVSLYKYYKYKIRHPDRFVFKHGNAGDIFNIDLIKYIYKEEPINVKNEGRRLLILGSIVNKIEKFDIVNGIGWKGNDLMHKSDLIASLKVYGVRGPLTKSLFEKNNSDLSHLKFEYDPGLLIKEVYNLDLKNSVEKQIVFIPHFKDLSVYKGNYPKEVKLVNIDNSPRKIAQEILKAKIVYASSLHGLIFSHALNKPCVFVKPQSDESIFKYRDYFYSIGLDLPVPVKDIYNINSITNKATTLDRKVELEDFYFPDIQELKDAGIIN